MNWNGISFFYSDHYDVPLKDGHRFPMSKYRLLRQSLVEQDILTQAQCVAAEPIDEKHLLLAHDPAYVQGILDLSLDPKKVRAVGLPLIQEMVNRARSSAQAFTNAVDESVTHGFAASLAGGTHHAHYDQGEGFCFFNDFAINVRRLYQQYPQKKILILDLDVHQGNGNSSILKDDPNVYIVSFHGKDNYPYRKISSHLDVAFDNGTEGDVYLKKLEEVLSQLKAMNFDHLFYQAGVDTLAADSFGKLSLSHEALMERDKLVFNWSFSQHIPLAMAIGGGYAKDINQTVMAYVNTFKVAKELYSKTY